MVGRSSNTCTSELPIDNQRQPLWSSGRVHWVLWVVLLSAGAAFRIAYWAGFMLGDDLGYIDLARRVLNGSFLDLPFHHPFHIRPLVYGPIAVAFRCFGVNWWSVGVPTFVASMVCLPLVYRWGCLLGDRVIGLLAMSLLAVSPFTVANATTITNEIPLSFLLYASLLLILEGERSRKNGMTWMILAGVIGGLAVQVKVNALMAPFVVAAYSFYRSFKGKPNAQSTIGWYLFGFLCCLLLFDSFYAAHTGRWVNNYLVERDFYLPMTEPPGDYWAFIRNQLLFYPRIAFGAERGNYGQFLVYGWLFYLVVLALPLCIWLSRSASVAMLVVAFVVIGAGMQFMPNRIGQLYIPIHRLDRFLEILTIPAVLMGSLLVHVGLVSRIRTVRIITGIVFALFLMHSSMHAVFKKRFYTDCMSDMRSTATFLNQYQKERDETLNVWSDFEAEETLTVYLGFDTNFVFRAFDWSPDDWLQHLRPGDLVIFGGSRRPDSWSGLPIAHRPANIPDHWVLEWRHAGKQQPWRESDLEIYRILAEASELKKKENSE